MVVAFTNSNWAKTKTLILLIIRYLYGSFRKQEFPCFLSALFSVYNTRTLLTTITLKKWAPLMSLYMGCF
jgi:hypothetical protein